MDRSTTRRRLLARLSDVSWRDLLVTLLALSLLLALATWAAVRLVRPAVPKVLTISTGPEGSAFQRAAERYAKAFAANGVTLRLRASNGSLENLQRVADPSSEVELGFVQVGVKLPDPKPGEPERRELVTLGTIARQPLFVLVRGKAAPDRLGALAGKRLVVGPEGSGTRVMALRLLQASGVDLAATTLLDLDDDAVGAALSEGRVDAAFLMADSASTRVIRGLVQRPDIQVVRLAQLDAILRRMPDLDRIVIPMGAFDLAKNVPAADLELPGATVEVVSHAGLHPALSDLLIETMRQVHARGTLLQRPGEFPAPREHELPLGDDARRYYDSGKRWLFRVLPFWAASLADRFLVVLLPLVLLLVPVLRLVPGFYRWRVRQRLYRVYGALLDLEHDVSHRAPGDRAALLGRLDEIQARADELELPLSFADQLYVLREHVQQVRRRLASPG